jgi:hypothetical protein
LTLQQAVDTLKEVKSLQEQYVQLRMSLVIRDVQGYYTFRLLPDTLQLTIMFNMEKNETAVDVLQTTYYQCWLCQVSDTMEQAPHWPVHRFPQQIAKTA